jgi:hypothetical protein
LISTDRYIHNLALLPRRRLGLGWSVSVLGGCSGVALPVVRTPECEQGALALGPAVAEMSL